MMFRWCRGLVLITATIAVASSCQKTRAPMTADQARIANRLSGVWNMQLELVRSPLIAFDASHAPREIRGKLELLVNSSLDRSFEGVGIPTNYGSYDLDLTRFGFDPRTAGVPPTAVAGLVSKDSVGIILSPGSDTGRMILVGRLEGETVSGRWRVTLERATGDGRFILRRGVAPSSQ